MEILAGCVIFMLGWIKVDLKHLSDKLDNHSHQDNSESRKIIVFNRRSTDQ